MQRIAVLASLLGALALGCGSDPVSPAATGGTTGTGGAGGTTGGSSATGGSGGSGLTAPVCERPSFADDSLPKVTVGEITAIVLELDAAPVVEAPVTVCGVDLCSDLRKTNQDGEASVFLPSAVTKPAFKYGDGLLHGELALLLPDAEDGLGRLKQLIAGNELELAVEQLASLLGQP